MYIIIMLKYGTSFSNIVNFITTLHTFTTMTNLFFSIFNHIFEKVDKIYYF